MKKAYPESNDTIDAMANPVGSIEITKVVRHSVPLYDNGTGSIGNAVDRMLEETAMRGEEAQSITVEMSPEWWNKFREAVNKSN